MTKDLTETFRKGIENSVGYNAGNIRKELEKFKDIDCRFDEDGNFLWYDIYMTNGEGIGRTLIQDYGWLSNYFPVAVLKENCPEYIKNFLEKNNIIIDSFINNVSYSCDENILKQYFWNDYIAYGYEYITPYDFDFYDIIRI